MKKNKSFIKDVVFVSPSPFNYLTSDIAIGVIVSDSRPGFEPGMRVETSPILSKTTLKNGQVRLTTRRTFYYLE